jgi:hypothetical protein
MEQKETKVHNKRLTTRIIKKGLATLLITGISKVNSQYGFYSRPTNISYPYKLVGKVVGENYITTDIYNYGHVLQMANGDKIAVCSDPSHTIKLDGITLTKIPAQLVLTLTHQLLSNQYLYLLSAFFVQKSI